MCAETYRTGEPYKLAGDRIVFTNWYYINCFYPEWYDHDGNNVSINGDQDDKGATIDHDRWPWGIHLSVRHAIRTGPIFKEERPWEDGGLGAGTFIKDGDIYKAWCSSGWGDMVRRKEYFCYFESKDGMNWERPNCGIIEYDGNRNNNLIDVRGGTVFIDPSAPESERYKWTCRADLTKDEYKKYCRNRPGQVDARPDLNNDKKFLTVRGAISPDGLHWEIIKEPIAITHSDTQIIAYYDTFLKKYVCYFRDWMVGPYAGDKYGKRYLHNARRAIGRAETDDFRKFPLPEVIIEPDPYMQPSVTLYTNGKTTIPGAPDQHLMFPVVWDQADDTTHVNMLSSHNGKIWNYIPGGRPVLETSDFGEWDGGCIFAVPNLIELANGDFALPYTGYNVPHKYPRMKATRGIGYALWPKGRIVALETTEKGEFSTVAIVPPGTKLYINAVTKSAGNIIIEAVGPDGNPIPGREFENSIPLVGDLFNSLVVWKEHNDIGIESGQAVILRFRMVQSSIYSLEFKKV